MSRIKVLFICVHNSGRSQMAEELLRKLGGERFVVESAGVEPRNIHPLVIEVMKEEGSDLSDKRAKDVWDLFRSDRNYDYVITVCDRSVEDRCPVFPGLMKRMNWPFQDPSTVEGTKEERLEKVRAIRDGIRERVLGLIDFAESKNPDKTAPGEI